MLFFVRVTSNSVPMTLLILLQNSVVGNHFFDPSVNDRETNTLAEGLAFIFALTNESHFGVVTEKRTLLFHRGVL